MLAHPVGDHLGILFEQHVPAGGAGVQGEVWMPAEASSPKVRVDGIMLVPNQQRRHRELLRDGETPESALAWALEASGVLRLDDDPFA